MEKMVPIIESLSSGKIVKDSGDIKIYEKSLKAHDNVHLLMVKDGTEKFLLAAGSGPLFDELDGEAVAENGKVCALTHDNRLVLNKYFDYTVPRAFGTEIATIGLGDRLGLASPGHIQTVQGKKVKPVLAQQSIRELDLTNRSMTDILDSAAFAVFQEGYTGGYGADGDHIKKESDIQHALELGVSMITLDCSDQIDKTVEEAPVDQLETAFNKLPQETIDYYNDKYLDQTFEVNGLSLTFDKEAVMKNVLLYDEAIEFTALVFDKYIRPLDRPIDFEISIDETETITSPLAHFFVGNELITKDVEVISLAPRFCGEFQKGIDYIGDIDQFEVELREHALIAEHLGYKLSIHSGSDKFAVFPIIAKYTKGVLHIKTAGTNWLEAIRVIANVNPDLYRRMHVFALDNFEKTLKYYHVTPDLESIDALDSVSDDKLPEYMNDDAARQLFHVTYGLILTEADAEGNYVFKDEFYKTLHDHEAEYDAALIHHIGRHLETLGL